MMKKNYIYIIVAFALFYQTIDAQCYPDRHSTSWFDGWISCEMSPNPIESYGVTHWILYDLGYEYELRESKFWNTNDPKNLNDGMNEFDLDYSLDGQNWTNLGSFNLEQGPGSTIYEGAEGPDFELAKARYVLITPTSNHGGDCFGFSEMKINITDPFDIVREEDGFNALVYPNPFEEDINLRIVTLDETQPIHYKLHDMLGRPIMSNSVGFIADTEIYSLPLNGRSLSAGMYIITIEQNGKSRAFKIVKRQ